MKWIFYIIPLAVSCQSQTHIEIGQCVIGTRMDVWKLLQKDGKNFIFTTLPAVDGAPMEIVDDVSAFKRVDCPQ